MRIVRTAASFVALVVAGAAFAVAGSGPAFAHNVKPIVECVYHDTKTGQYNSVWGYNNNDSIPTVFLVGPDNGFSPSPQGRGQPTIFQPGQHDNVFTITWSGAGALTWTLNTHSADATTSSPACATNPVPLVTIQTVVWIAVGLAAAAAAVALRRRHPRPAPTPTA